MKKLSIVDHSRAFANNTYVYPVLSRRSQGISLGINLNINNACNWRCAYCQVDGLIRGKPTTIDLDLLESELDFMLNQIVYGDFLQTFAPSGMQRFNDIAISGNGESTLSKEFLAVVKTIAKLRAKYNLNNNLQEKRSNHNTNYSFSSELVKTVLITNGSEIEKPEVLLALDILALNNGEVWFKVDRATPEGIALVNQVALSLDGIKHRLILSSQHCKTYIQTCMFQNHGVLPSQFEVDEYIKFVLECKSYIVGVLLYSVARNPALPEGANISQVSDEFLQNIADSLNSVGVTVQYYI
jgi:wyosine [tRNA(Phe)-imidazoG37] synthetase (radical SAM superfamily)